MKAIGEHSRKVLVLLAAAVVLYSTAAFALSFTPSESEWLLWPDYCRARYVVSGAGQNSEFVSRVPAAEVARQKAKVGAEAWYWLHHHCAALAYLRRAEQAESEQREQFWLREADVNFMGMYARISKNNHMFPDVVIGIARMHKQRGDYGVALRFLDESISAQPTASSPYAMSATLRSDAGELEEAINVLLRGNEALNGESAEIHYFLGHMYLKKDDVDSAVAHAKRAYELGYPLPGLASKLQRLGRSIS